MKKIKLVNVTWEDIHTESGWVDDDVIDSYDKTPPAICVSIGLLIFDEESHIVLAGSFEPSAKKNKWGDVSYIPRSVIKKIRIIDRISC